MNTMNEGKQEVIVNHPANRDVFPNALPFDNSPIDSSPIDNRVLVQPVETNDQVRQAIERGARERDKHEVPIDRRDPEVVRRTRDNFLNGAGVLRGQATTIAAKIAEVRKTIDALKKLHKHWGKAKSNRFAEEAQKQIQERIIAAEDVLSRLEKKEKSIASDIKQNAKALKDFLASRPKPEFPSNEEVLAMFNEAQSLERELHQMDHLASSKSGFFI